MRGREGKKEEEGMTLLSSSDVRLLERMEKEEETEEEEEEERTENPFLITSPLIKS